MSVVVGFYPTILMKNSPITHTHGTTFITDYRVYNFFLYIISHWNLCVRFHLFKLLVRPGAAAQCKKSARHVQPGCRFYSCFEYILKS